MHPILFSNCVPAMEEVGNIISFLTGAPCHEGPGSRRGFPAPQAASGGVLAIR